MNDLNDKKLFELREDFEIMMHNHQHCVHPQQFVLCMLNFTIELAFQCCKDKEQVKEFVEWVVDKTIKDITENENEL
jgi:hypothetical protein